MFPLQDNIRSIKYPIINGFLILLNIAAFVFEITRPDIDQFVVEHGLVASRLLQHFDLAQVATVFTSMFMHTSAPHIISNLWILYIFGDNVEDTLGHWKYLLFYLLCGVVADVTHILVLQETIRPCIGASGAIAGVLAAYLVLHPKAKVQTQILIWFPMIRAWVIIGGWFLLNCISAYFQLDDSVGWFAHIGGFIAGALLISFLTVKEKSDTNAESTRVREVPAMSWVTCVLLMIVYTTASYAATSFSNNLIRNASLRASTPASRTTKTKSKSTATRSARPSSAQKRKSKPRH